MTPYSVGDWLRSTAPAPRRNILDPYVPAVLVRVARVVGRSDRPGSWDCVVQRWSEGAGGVLGPREDRRIDPAEWEPAEAPANAPDWPYASLAQQHVAERTFKPCTGK